MKKWIVAVVLFWLTVVGIAFWWNLRDEVEANEHLAFETARAFFQQVQVTRAWNALHGGVYAKVGNDFQPNPYLTDPLRDLTTAQGIKLSKINPAYMTRQIAEIADKQNGIKFHITSLKLIRPANKATAWEEQCLQSFARGAKEEGGFFSAGSTTYFRYMAPLVIEKSCLRCHAKQGYKVGDIRGGISVTIPYLSKRPKSVVIIGYSLSAVVGVALILLGGTLLERKRKQLVQSNESLQKGIAEREKLIADLQEANKQIKTLSGIVPICMYCKQIRDDQGYWNQVEKFISAHSTAQFSHGICPKCMKEKHPDVDPDAE